MKRVALVLVGLAAFAAGAAASVPVVVYAAIRGR